MTAVLEPEARQPTIKGPWQYVSVAVEGGWRRFKSLAYNGYSHVAPDRTQRWQVLGSNGRDKYWVGYDADKKWSCSCPSFQYKSGLDADGNCKHIRMMLAKRKGASDA